MLREFPEAVDALTVSRPLLLVLEDLHTSDRATTLLVAYLAHRREPARLLLIGSYPPAEVIAGGHPLRRVVQDPRSTRGCEHLALELLSTAEIDAYLSPRLSPRTPSSRFVADVQERTAGDQGSEDGRVEPAAHYQRPVPCAL
jgi:predicted ATPase